MNSRERRFLNLCHDNPGSDPLELAPQAGLSVNSAGYYLSKWASRGWLEDGQLTDRAPGKQPTLREQMQAKLEPGTGE